MICRSSIKHIRVSRLFGRYSCILPGKESKGPLREKYGSPWVDAAMLSALGLFVAFAVWLSATGGERASILVVSLILIMLVAVLFALGLVFGRRRVLVLWAGLVSIAVLASVGFTHWPLRCAYPFARECFEEMAAQVASGTIPTMPQQVGCFTIEKAEVSPTGVVCLWTMPDPAGNTGFVRCPPTDIPFNLWSVIRLDGRWQYISED